MCRLKGEKCLHRQDLNNVFIDFKTVKLLRQDLNNVFIDFKTVKLLLPYIYDYTGTKAGLSELEK